MPTEREERLVTRQLARQLAEERAARERAASEILHEDSSAFITVKTTYYP